MAKMPAVFVSGIITNEGRGEWKRATCICVNENATVEHFAPARKKCSVYAHTYTTRGVREWRDTDTCFTETLYPYWRNCSYAV